MCVFAPIPYSTHTHVYGYSPEILLLPEVTSGLILIEQSLSKTIIFVCLFIICILLSNSDFGIQKIPYLLFYLHFPKMCSKYCFSTSGKCQYCVNTIFSFTCDENSKTNLSYCFHHR